MSDLGQIEINSTALYAVIKPTALGVVVCQLQINIKNRIYVLTFPFFEIFINEI